MVMISSISWAPLQYSKSSALSKSRHPSLASAHMKRLLYIPMATPERLTVLTGASESSGVSLAADPDSFWEPAGSPAGSPQARTWLLYHGSLPYC